MGCTGSKEYRKHSKKYTCDSLRDFAGLAIERTSEIFSHYTNIPDFNLGQHYEPIKILGDGGTSETWLVREKITDRLFAFKAIERPIIIPITELLKREIEIQAKIGEGHLNIVNLHEVILTETHLALVQEYAQGGSLTSYLSARHEANKHLFGRNNGLYLSEDEALYFFRQFISAVEFCHKNKIMHRDLKLDNTLLDGSHPPLIKICDFGFAKAMESEEETSTQTIIGTPVYMSPEILACEVGKERAYDGKSADVWSSGIMLFVMLIGAFPFDHTKNINPDSQAAYKKILRQQTKSKWFECAGTPEIKNSVALLTTSCKDLLNRILVTDLDQRISIEDLKKHPWFTRKLPAQLDSSLKRLEHAQAQLDQIFNMHESTHLTSIISNIIDEAAKKHNAIGTLLRSKDSDETANTQIIVDNIKRLPLKTGIDTFTKDRTYNEFLRQESCK